MTDHYAIIDRAASSVALYAPIPNGAGGDTCIGNHVDHPSRFDPAAWLLSRGYVLTSCNAMFGGGEVGNLATIG
jgi:hypothetical protein